MYIYTCKYKQIIKYMFDVPGQVHDGHVAGLVRGAGRRGCALPETRHLPTTSPQQFINRHHILLAVKLPYEPIVGRSVCHNFKFHFQCSHQRTCYYIYWFKIFQSNYPPNKAFLQCRCQSLYEWLTQQISLEDMICIAGYMICIAINYFKRFDFRRSLSILRKMIFFQMRKYFL